MENQEQAVETKTEPSKLSQKDAVYKFTMDSLPENPRGDSIKELVTKDVRKVIRQKLYEAVKAGDVRLSKQYDEGKLKKYCSGLINNWLNKDPRYK